MVEIATICTAIVQGITEFLPISSSTHLTILARLGGWPEPSLALKVGMHVGTLLSVVTYFAKDLWQMTCGFFQLLRGQRNLPGMVALYLVIATLPAVVVGYVVHKLCPNQAYTPMIMGSASIVGGLLMIWANTRPERYTQINLRQAVIIGLGQVVALLWPGSSRSGSCVTLAQWLGIERRQALRFTFLLSIPTVFGAAVLMSLNLRGADIAWEGLTQGIVIAAIFGYLTIRILYRLWSASALWLLGIYRVVLGAAILLFL